MYAFQQLEPNPDSWCTSLAYWVGTLHGDIPLTHSTPDALASAMSYHFDTEEQCCSEEHLRSTPELLFDVFRPVAPVTIAERWSPIPMFIEHFNGPVLHGADLDRKSMRPAFAVFNPQYLGDSDFAGSGIHERHAYFLARLASARAELENARILVVAQPGWSYEAVIEIGLMNPHSAIFMNRAGYIFTERLPLT